MLHERLAKLSNRLTAEAQGRILGAVHERIPMATADEQREVQLANVRAEAETWASVADWHVAALADSKTLLASAEKNVAAKSRAAKVAASLAEEVKEHVTKIKRGEDVAAGFGEPTNLTDALLRCGFTKSELRRFERSAGLTEEQFEAVLAEKLRRQEAATNWLPRKVRSLRPKPPA